MMLKKTTLLVLLLALILRAQEGELTLDPNDIPLTPDPALEVPVDNNLPLPDLSTPSPGDPAMMPPPTETAPQVTQPPADTLAPQRVEEFKPTPSNLDVRSNQPSGDSDTAKKEERFNKAYTKFHKESTPSQNWEKVVGKRTSDTYVVNKGDTLWDISGTLFGDPFYWPKVWSLNKDLIYNPHVIFPDMKIKFFQGDSKSVPTLATDNQTAPPAENPEVAQTQPQPEAPVTPPQNEPAPKSEKITQILRKLPSSFAEKDLRVTKEVEIQIEERNNAPLPSRVNQEFYLSEQELSTLGKVVEMEDDYKTAGYDQYVYVKFEGAPQGIYTVVKPGKPLPSTATNTYSVDLYEVEGELQVLNKVNSDENVYRTKVLKSNTLVSSGSLVIAGRMKTFNLADSISETTASQGRIIGNLSNYGFVGQGNFVVVNQGSQSGYQPNMKLPIYEDLASRNSKSLVKENPQKVGSVIIVDSTQNYSVGYIATVRDRVMINDFVAAAEGSSEGAPQSASAEGTDGAAENFEDVAPANPEDAPVEEF